MNIKNYPKTPRIAYEVHTAISEAVAPVFFILLLLVGVSSASAAVLFDSTSNPVFGADPVGSGIALNASFSSQSLPTELSEIGLLWQRGADDKGVIDVFLLSDSNAKPGKRLYKLATANAGSLPIGEQWLALPLEVNKPLSPKTRYWIEVMASTPAGSLAYSRSHLGYGVAGEAYLNGYGLHQNSVTGPYIFKITASPSRAQ